MELDIEKQKYNKLLEKTRDEGRGAEDELREQVQKLKTQQKNELCDFHKQLAENKARSREAESSLKQEIQNLKKVGCLEYLSVGSSGADRTSIRECFRSQIIADLEQRLSRLDTGFDSKSLEMRHEVKKLQNELREAAEENRKLEQQVASTKEEVVIHCNCTITTH